MTAAGVPDWDDVAAALSDALATMPADGVIQVQEAADPEDGRYAQIWRRGEVLHAEVGPVHGGGSAESDPAGHRVAGAGWLPPDDEHSVNWWLSLDLPAPPQATRELAERIVAALRDGFGLGSPAELAYQAWSSAGPMSRPDLGLPRISVEYFALLGTGDTPERPAGLLRRVRLGGREVDEELGRDGQWRPSATLESAELGDLLGDVEPVDADLAISVVDEWRRLAGGHPPEAAAPPSWPRLAEATDGRRDADGRPLVPPTLLAEHERQPVVDYLLEAPVVMAAFGVGIDLYDPEQPDVVPLNVHTDGDWVWSESLAYFAGRYGYPPQRELLEHIRRRGYRVPEVGSDAMERAARLLMG